MRIYYVYILASLSRILYTGVTSNLEQRVWQHKHRINKGFTSRYRVNRLVYYEEYDYVYNAIAREMAIKGWRRDRKVALIESMNASWDDLSAGWYA